MNKNLLIAALSIIACGTASAIDMKQAPAVLEAVTAIEKMGCKPWLGVMIPAKRLVRSNTDDNAFVVPMFCEKIPQSIVVAQKSGKVFVSNQKFKVVSTIKFDGKSITGMATRHQDEKSSAYKIVAFE